MDVTLHDPTANGAVFGAGDGVFTTVGLRDGAGRSMEHAGSMHDVVPNATLRFTQV